MPANFEQQAQLQLLRERCELLQTLTQLYISSIASPISGSGRSIGKGDGVSISQFSAVNSPLVSCSSDRFVLLLEAVGRGMFRSVRQDWGGSAEAGAAAVLAEALVSREYRKQRRNSLYMYTGYGWI